MKNLLSVSIRGASHITDNLPMQDYSASIITEDYSIGIVCDGHGSKKHCRSDVGSRLATEVCLAKLQEFYTLFPTLEQVNVETERKMQRLKLAIISSWQCEIERYHNLNPLSETEAGYANSSETFKERKGFDVAQPYGTTMLAAMVTKEYEVLLVIGDGEMYGIGNKHWELIKFAGKDEYADQVHSATDSLCMPNCYNALHHIVRARREDISAYGLCTDGLSEAYSTSYDISRVLLSYLNYYVDKGEEVAIRDITAQLKNISKVSVFKDDISVAFATLWLDRFGDKAIAEANEASDEPEAKEEQQPKDDVKEEATEEITEDAIEDAIEDTIEDTIEEVTEDTIEDTIEDTDPFTETLGNEELVGVPEIIEDLEEVDSGIEPFKEEEIEEDTSNNLEESTNNNQSKEEQDE